MTSLKRNRKPVANRVKGKFGFKVLAQDPKTHARVGKVVTAHGTFETPVYLRWVRSSIVFRS